MPNLTNLLTVCNLIARKNAADLDCFLNGSTGKNQIFYFFARRYQSNEDEHGYLLS
jgi:hypothetical protein